MCSLASGVLVSPAAVSFSLAVQPALQLATASSQLTSSQCMAWICSRCLTQKIVHSCCLALIMYAGGAAG